jgi:ABC-type transporter Mla subunit MlaD
MLEERTRLMATLETLLDAVNHASTAQRGAIDALLGSSAELLERVGNRFAEQVESQAGKLEQAAAQLTASASEVAGLGEAFGAGVAQFGETGDALVQRLQQLAEALAGAQARSDEQLAYYVAQAREVVELSVLSQQQIIGEMQQLAGRRAPGKAARA